MEQRNSEQKTAQILYITIILVLLIMAVTVGLVTAANKAKEGAMTTADTATSDTSAESSVTTKAPVQTTAITTAKAPETTTTARPVQTTALTTKTKPAVAEPAPLPLPTFSMPTNGNISAEFSIDTLVFSNTMEDYRTHNGIDICAPVGSAVCAAADGVVSEVYEHPMMGYTVVVAHDGDAESVYQNLDDEVAVSVGDIVKSGDVIGAVGESAIIEIAEEPHLHFEMCIAGERVNPLDYIDESKATMSYEE